jgi:hypothetical protein
MSTTVDDLATWLTQILDQDEARVRAAIADDCGQDGGFEDAFDLLTGHGPLAFVPRFGEAAAAMIVWQTPRRALARIEADRQMLKRCTDYLASHLSDDFSGDSLAEDIVKGLALPHADRPGYREEWRP